MSTQDPFQPPSGAWNPSAATTPYADAYGTPASGAPAYGAPAYGAPAYGAPAYGAPAYGAPAYAAPAYGAPAYEQPYGGGYGFPPGAFGFAPTYASWTQRVRAYLLDSVAIAPYLLGLFAMSVMTTPGTDAYGNPTDQPSPAGLGAFALGGLVSLALWAWNRWFVAGRTGQSWGKKAVGLTMQKDADGQPIGVWMAFVRDLAHYVDGFFYLGYLWPLWDSQRQTFSDKLTKTVVVS
ncbi:MAG: RDD family protein [Cellulomonas sp.]